MEYATELSRESRTDVLVDAPQWAQRAVSEYRSLSLWRQQEQDERLDEWAARQSARADAEQRWAGILDRIDALTPVHRRPRRI